MLAADLLACVAQIMAVLSEALRTHGASPCHTLRLQALSGWCSFVRCLAAHAPQLLERVAAQASVVLLPVLEEGGEALQAAVKVGVAHAGSITCSHAAGVLRAHVCSAQHHS